MEINNNVGVISTQAMCRGEIRRGLTAVTLLCWPTVREGQRSTERVGERDSFNLQLSVQSSLRHLSLISYKGAFSRESEPFYLLDISPSSLSSSCERSLSSRPHLLRGSPLSLCLCHQACGSTAHSLTAGFFELMIAIPPILLPLPISSVNASVSRMLFVSSGDLPTQSALWDLASVMFSVWSLLFKKQMKCCCCLYVTKAIQLFFKGIVTTSFLRFSSCAIIHVPAMLLPIK